MKNQWWISLVDVFSGIISMTQNKIFREFLHWLIPAHSHAAAQTDNLKIFFLTRRGAFRELRNIYCS